jgi:aspartate 1-decarboxylase
VCVNGAAAHLVVPGDRVIVASFVEVEDAEAAAWRPNVVFVDASNRIVARREELAGQGEAIRLER